MSQTVAPADPFAGSRDRAVLGRAARVAERLLCRSRVARRRRRHRALARAERRADAGSDAVRAIRRRRRRRRRRALARPDAADAERMKLAEGRPLRRRMMAAMAQQDCGQCGYNCEDYSSSIV